jgi:hypothetical protein
VADKSDPKVGSMMDYTVFMTAALIVSYTLMFALVSFAEYVIGRQEFEPTSDQDVGIAECPSISTSSDSGSRE